MADTVNNGIINSGGGSASRFREGERAVLLAEEFSIAREYVYQIEKAETHPG